MKVRVSTLCDAASIREGLLSVLGAGVNRLVRDSVPAAMLASYAALLEITPDEWGRDIQVTITVGFDYEEETLVERGVISIPEQPADLRTSVMIPIVLDLSQFVLHQFGPVRLNLTVDGQVVDTLTAEVVESAVGIPGTEPNTRVGVQ